MASALAQVVTADATAEGYCTNGGSCTDANGKGLTLAGPSAGQIYRDWFTFTVPDSFVASSATVSIYNSNVNLYGKSPDAVFSLYAATSLTYTGLIGTGPALGSVTASVADPNPYPANKEGGYVSITLNAQGLDYLNAHRGKAITLGGSGPDVSSAQFFGYNTAHVAQLQVSPVPEPESYALLMAGLGLLIPAVRRNRKR